MLKLSKIIKATLNEVYKTRPSPQSGSAHHRSRVDELVSKIASLNAQLSDWHSGLPNALKLGNLGELVDEQSVPNSPALTWKDQLLQLQALALKLAFENTRILIHRPLLSQKVTRISRTSDRSASGPAQNQLNLSIRTCREAALQISRVSKATIFCTASTTYALSFVSLHLLTAGVTLCIMASLDPLNKEAQEWKLGIRRLMEMLMILKSRTILADQGLQLLKKLFRLVVEKEVETMANVDSFTDGPSVADTSERATGSQSFGKYSALQDDGDKF
jgi:hypothetical protein